MDQDEDIEICKEAVALIKEFESLHDGDLSHIGLQPKLDPIGIWTVGYGHALYNSEGKALKGKENKDEAYRQFGFLTEEGAEALLKQDLQKFASKVKGCIKVPLNPYQFGACVSLAYNIGVGAFKVSSVCRMINNNDFDGATDAFKLWVRAGGRKLPGLVRRREAEAKLFKTTHPA